MRKLPMTVQERKTIAVFIPLEIDAAFNGPDYILGNNNLPKTMLPGLDFYNGVLMAIDSLKKTNTLIDIRIIDTKQKNNSLATLLTDSSLQKTGIIISAVTNKADTKLIADFALAHTKHPWYQLFFRTMQALPIIRFLLS